ncbi:hypothetical protein BJX70DRAFT_364201 [Aspergillus crustosus]
MPGYIPSKARGSVLAVGASYILIYTVDIIWLTITAEHHVMPVLMYIVTRIFQTYSKVADYNSRLFTERAGMTLENANGVWVGRS